MSKTAGAPSCHGDRELALTGSVVTVGAFDGVHRGHQALIGQTVRAASERRLPSVVYTFDTPPKVYFGGADALIPLCGKLRRIAAFRPDHIIVARFDEAYARRTAADFIDEIRAINPILILVGDDFRFGSCKSGSIALLREHFDIRTLPPVRCDAGEVISSSRIRDLRRCGRGAVAAALEGWKDRLNTPSDVRGSNILSFGNIHP